MKKLSKEKKRKIKEVAFKVLHTVCYILSALFLLTMLIVGLQSCKQAQSTSAEYYPDGYSLIYNRESNFTLTASEQTAIGDDEVNCVSSTGYTEGYTVNMVYPCEYTAVYNNQVYDCISYNILFTVYWDGGEDLNYFRITSISLGYDGGSLPLAYKTDTDYDSGDEFEYTSYSVNNVIVYTYNANYPLFNYLFTPINRNQTQFVFNKVFNYNSPLGTTIDGAYGDAVFDSLGQNMRYKNINCGYFYSNGQLYNQIQYWAIQSDGNTILSNVNGSISPTSAPSGYWIYSFIYYRNTLTGDEVLVNYHEQLPLGQTTKYYDNASVWVNDSFRYITFLQPLDEENSLIINSFNNNNQTGYYGTIGSEDIINVFTLLSGAFASWLPILNMYLLPSITIGMLLFIPLVAMLVFAIIRIIKK